MSAELDRKIAIEVMGEPEPSPLPTNASGVTLSSYSVITEAGNWRWNKCSGWKPAPFSSDFEEAMRAADTFFEQSLPYRKGITITYDLDEEKPWGAQHIWHNLGRDVSGATLPEAICHFLLWAKGREK